jgi:hypothetical protein
VVEIGVMFGVLAGACLGLILILLRRRNGPTENTDGLLIEQARRVQAHHERTAYQAGVIDGAPPAMGDHHRP